MVKIRLKRMGATKHAKYRLVVVDSRTRRDGRVLAEVGYYDPQREPVELRVKEEDAVRWLLNGAQPSETVRTLLGRAGTLEAFEKAKAEAKAAKAV
ncbi:MAG: 30S ribosomal protein S16 [Candidatus Sericytochromatia bacterium]|nr:30S ribosomal protein S16 [Candidatus Sericytochromatia bacterium]